MRTFLLWLLLFLVGVANSTAQSLTIIGAAEDPAVRTVTEVFERDDFRMLDRDTVIPADAVLGDLVIVDARVALEGRIEGDVVVVGGDFFVRPDAAVAGSIVVLAGGAYPSGLAEIGEVLTPHPRFLLQRVDEEGRITLILSEPPPPGALRIPSLFGFGVPRYDRVDGLTVTWRAALVSPGDSAKVALDGHIGLATERKRVSGGLELQIRPGHRSMITLDARRATRTVDYWILGDRENSFAALLARSDLRNYFESDEASFSIARTPPPPIIEGEGFIVPEISLRVSRDRSLEEGSPWSLLHRDEPWRENPPIDEGVLASIVTEVDTGWRGASSTFNGSLIAEWAPGTVGDFDFAQLRARATWGMLSLFGHSIDVSGYVQLPIGSAEAPRQRWSFVGGPGTLPTFPTAALRGDHVLFVASTYHAPLTRLRIPVVGQPTLRLEHAAGTAWASGTPRPALEQNIGAGLRLRFVDVMVHIDPTASELDPSVTFGVHLPFDGRATF